MPTVVRPTVAQLTEAHRQGQLQIRAQSLQQLVRAWGAFDPQDIAGSWPRVEAPAVAITRAGFDRSAQLGGAYYSMLRAVRGIPGQPTPQVATAPPAEQLAEWLQIAPRWAGMTIARNQPGVTGNAFVVAAGTVGRNVMDGGRDTIVDSVQADPRAAGWARVTAPNPCGFCAMLASRGPVYKSAGSAGENDAYHPHCACTPQPIYSRSDPWPGRAREFREMWDEADGDRNAFRAAIEA